MAYGITSESQIIDLNAVKTGCNALKQAASDFSMSGKTVEKAGETCDEKALSIDDTSLQFSVVQLGQEMQELTSTINQYADEVIAEATAVYNAQMEEYKAYLIANKNNLNNQNNQNGGTAANA